MKIKLTVRNPNAPNPEPRKFAFSSGLVTVGREGCDITLPGGDQGASTRHAVIERADDGFVLKDAGSTNGTFHNGRRIERDETVPISDGDELYMGRWHFTCDIVGDDVQVSGQSPALRPPDPGADDGESTRDTPLSLGDTNAAMPAISVSATQTMNSPGILGGGTPPPAPAAAFPGTPVPGAAPPAPSDGPQIDLPQLDLKKFKRTQRDDGPPPPEPPLPHTLDRALRARLRRGEDERQRRFAEHRLTGDAEQTGQALQQAFDALDPLEVAPFLTGLVRLGEGRPGSAAAVAKVEEELARREELMETCFQALQRLSKDMLEDDEEFAERAQVVRFTRLLHSHVELILEWMVDSLGARRAFTEKFSANVTRFFGLDQNPCKSAFVPSQLATYLFKWNKARHEPKIKRDLEEAIRDLIAHQLSLVAGIQDALKKALEQVSPERHEQLAEENVSKLLPMRDMRVSSQAWLYFKTAYREMFNNDSKLFNEVILPNVREGYLKSHEELGISGEGE